MARCLSEDLRVRVIEAVGAGASRRQAAARFGVSVSSAIRWVDTHRREGRSKALPQGGDRRSQAIEAEAEFLRAAIREEPDITLAELRARLWRERGTVASVSALWRFFDRHRITLKKVRARGRAGARGREGAPRGLGGAAAGARPRAAGLRR